MGPGVSGATTACAVRFRSVLPFGPGPSMHCRARLGRRSLADVSGVCFEGVVNAGLIAAAVYRIPEREKVSKGFMGGERAGATAG